MRLLLAWLVLVLAWLAVQRRAAVDPNAVWVVYVEVGDNAVTLGPWAILAFLAVLLLVPPAVAATVFVSARTIRRRSRERDETATEQ